MKRLLICFALVFSFVCSISQTVTVDTLHVGTPQYDTLHGPLIACYDYNCNPVNSKTYVLSQAYSGAVDINGDGVGMFEVMVVTEDLFVHVDTCVVINPWAGGQYQLRFDFPDAAKIIINGSEGATITVLSKVEPGQLYALPSPILALDTICQIPTTIDAQLPTCEQQHYVNITTLIEYTDRSSQALPSGIYWQYCQDRRIGQKILVP